ncbi:DUF6934 family protein [Runella slithyformis]|uniref:Uncharacterized protein n=1 Tax=Runella slithyformis (strain ATCC 29530 / DSM 19594 / LMG 11500 / NCIMB 11436 / LSU 4) TaxID=761193 RepID=A0A7U4E7C8_RUNSL|nr:hypothetical protein [Runella slithyformis]AEI50039.1 hypothetical protein Runsl_3681 [Runella slithyformis DSM 19594]
MNLEVYPLKDTSQEHTHFAFISEGKQGQIIKIIAYQPTGEWSNDRPIYNLGFGDYNLMTKEVDDKVVTDNGDTEKILATVAQTVPVFFSHYPNAILEVSGSTRGRTRLYKMLITKYMEELADFVTIYGLNDEVGELELFIPDKKYSRFFAIKK